jgi:hypothetical protein
MDIAPHRRRLFAALIVTAVALIVAAVGLALAFGLHASWGLWLFGGAIVAGFASHWRLMLGVLREKQSP